MFKLKSIVTATILSIFTALSAQANWSVIERPGQNSGFVISLDEVVEIPENNITYAYVEYGVISKIIYWTPKTGSYITNYVPASSLTLDTFKDVVFLSKLPQSLKVSYTSINGLAKADAINQGDIINVIESIVLEPTGLEDVEVTTTTQVLSKSINNDYSTSITLAPPVSNNPNETVEVQVITNGISFTSIATDNTSNPITINNLPSNEYVTIQTVFRDTMTTQSRIYQEVPIVTADANAPVLVSARDSIQDRAIISAPETQSTINGDVKSATISFAPITNFDSSKTMASIMVVGPNGSTTSIGIDGNGGTVNVSDLSAMSTYTVKVVIRDINSGEETIINGNNL